MDAPLAIPIARALRAALALVSLALPLMSAVPAQAVAPGPYTLEVLVDEYSFAAPATGTWDLPPLNAPVPTYGWDGDPSKPLGGGVQ